MKKLSLSPLDLGVIIAFVVIGLLGGGAWWYLSGELTAATDATTAAKSAYDAVSVNGGIVVSPSNKKTLETNIDLLKSHLNPLITTKLLAKDNTLGAITQQDPVAWKHDLNKELAALNAAAKAHGVKVPANFYFGFSSYISKNPSEDQTLVLDKQLRAIKLITTILINSPVKSIGSIKRTYEEDPRSSGGQAPTAADTDRLGGLSSNSPADAYTAYPFEFELEGATDSLRKIVDDLVQSPYVFIIRAVEVHNQVLASPQLSDLEKMVGTGAQPSVTGSSPGEVAAAPVLGPQFLFSNNTLHLKLRVDLIEWKVPATEAPKAAK